MMCWPRESRCCAAAASRRSSSCLQQRCRHLQTLREVSCWAIVLGLLVYSYT